jgi:hypothetical protein
VVIGFLASLLGIGDFAKKVQGIVEKIRLRIDKAIEKLLQKAKKLFKGKKNKDKDNKGKDSKESSTEQKKKVDLGLAQLHKEEAKYGQNGKLKQKDAKKAANTVKKDNPVFKSITVLESGKNWKYNYIVQKAEEESKLKKDENEQDLNISFSKQRHQVESLRSNTPIKKDTTMIFEDYDLSIVKQDAINAYKSSGKKGGFFESQGIRWQYDVKINSAGKEYIHLNPTHSPPKAINLSKGEAHAVQNYKTMRNQGKSHEQALAKLRELSEQGVYPNPLTNNILIFIEKLK